MTDIGFTFLTQARWRFLNTIRLARGRASDDSQQQHYDELMRGARDCDPLVRELVFDRYEEAAEDTLESLAEAAAVMTAHWGLGRESALIFANPVPVEAAIDPAELEGWISAALAAAKAEGIAGKAVTPFLLGQLAEVSAGRSLAANRALLIDNAKVAAEIACAYAAR